MTDDATTASFGYWVRRRRLALDLTQAALARRVGCSVPTVKKIERDERRPSRTMAARLAESLAVPAEERDQFVAMALGERSPAREPLTDAPLPDAGARPRWLDEVAVEPQSPFVGREGELAVLHRQLDDAVSGRGRVAFVAGEAGQGKTALLTAFGQQALGRADRLVVARGYATAAGGAGDPYLPVRDLFLMLLAAPEAGWQADQLSVEQADRLWAFAPVVARTIVDAGPQLVDAVVPRGVLAARLGGAAPRPRAPAADQPVRDQLLSQVTAVLTALAEHRPLLLLLDDLQWADVATAELLFHLRRRVGGARVLVLGAYRPSEVADADSPAARTLRQVVLEARQDDAAADLDLELDLDAGRKLCDALLDREPNDLDEDFRSRLFWQTRGQPLFVVELLREMQARGALGHDDAGRLVQRAAVDWQGLPVKVSALIQQRLERLERAEREVLEIAAAEGEHFTAEVVAAVAGLDETAVLRTLGRELERMHGLVRETSSRSVGGQTVTRYRFAHVLFQQYLYNGLGEGERRALHARVAGQLEQRHATELDTVVPSLAYHYAAAGDAQAVPYLLRAGDRARMVYAHNEAARSYQHAAAFLADDPDRAARTFMKLGLTYQTAFDQQRSQAAFDKAFALWRAAADAAAPPPATARLRMVWADPPSLDPTMGGYNLSAPVVTQLFAGLVAHGDDDEVLPDVAERWTVSPDGRCYTFHLRDDVVWTDEAPVTAHDFAFTYTRARDPDTAAPVAASLLDTVRSVEATDDRTLVVELTEPTSFLLYNLAYYVLLPVPRHVVEAQGEAWASGAGIVSNGPFELAEWQPGSHMRLVRNPRYHGRARGNLAEVRLDLAIPAEDHEARYAAGELDVLSTWFTPVDLLASAVRRFPDEHVRRQAFCPFFWVADRTRAPLDDPAVRRALVLAVDSDAVARQHLHGLMEPARGGLVPPGMPGHVPDLGLRSDLDEARRLVAASGAADGPEIAVVGSERWQCLVDSWRAVGLPCRLEPFGPREINEAWDAVAGPRVFVGGWWADYPDPDNFLRVCVRLNLDGWQDERYDELIDRAATTTDQPARLALYREAEVRLAEESLLVPIAYASEHLLLKPRVQHFPTVAVKHPGFWKDVVVED